MTQRPAATLPSPSSPPSHRSAVPDLLFDDVKEARLAEAAALLSGAAPLDDSTPLDRLTVFVTPRCNLRCPYCKAAGRGGGRRAAHDLASFERLLDGLGGAPLRHLHLTGGEATLAPDLPAMVRAARARGVGRVSLTSNGTCGPARMLALVEAGLDEARVSVDAADAAQGAALTGRPGAWGASVATVRALAEARRAGGRCHVVVNTVVTRANRGSLHQLVAALLALGPDDLKLITEVDGREGLGDFPGAAVVRAGLRALLAARPPAALPLLRLKLATVFDPDAIGLAGEPSRPGRRWRCLIPLTERTVDADAYYPCSVYLREGGAPLGPLGDPPARQRARSAAFAAEADCLADPICRRYCLHCTRAFNALAHRRLA